MDFNLKTCQDFVSYLWFLSSEVEFDYTLLPRLPSVPRDFKAVFLNVHYLHKPCMEHNLCFLYAAVHTHPYYSKIKTLSNVLHVPVHVQPVHTCQQILASLGSPGSKSYCLWKMDLDWLLPSSIAPNACLKSVIQSSCWTIVNSDAPSQLKTHITWSLWNDWILFTNVFRQLNVQNSYQGW